MTVPASWGSAADVVPGNAVKLPGVNTTALAGFIENPNNRTIDSMILLIFLETIAMVILLNPLVY
jgi:hypothetical protein